MRERIACIWPIKSAWVGFLIGVSHKLCIHRAYGTGALQSRSPQCIRRVRIDRVKGTWLTAAKQAPVFSPCKAGSRSHSCQLLSVKILFSASLALLQPITGVVIFKYYAKCKCFDVMYLLYVIRASFRARGHKVINCSCPDWHEWLLPENSTWVVESLLSTGICQFLYVVNSWIFPFYQQMLGTLFSCSCPLVIWMFYCQKGIFLWHKLLCSILRELKL